LVTILALLEKDAPGNRNPWKESFTTPFERRCYLVKAQLRQLVECLDQRTNPLLKETDGGNG